MSSVATKPCVRAETFFGPQSTPSCNEEIVKIKLSKEQSLSSANCKKKYTKTSVLASKFDVKKTFNKAIVNLNKFHWMESLVLLGACLVSLSIGGHCIFSFIIFSMLLLLLLACDNIYFSWF